MSVMSFIKVIIIYIIKRLEQVFFYVFFFVFYDIVVVKATDVAKRLLRPKVGEAVGIFATNPICDDFSTN